MIFPDIIESVIYNVNQESEGSRKVSPGTPQDALIELINELLIRIICFRVLREDLNTIDIN